MRLIAVHRDGIAVVDSSTGEVVHQLTKPQDPARDSSPSPVRSAGGTRVWYVHSDSAECDDGAEIDSVSISGGSPRTELLAPSGPTIGQLTASGSGGTVVYAAEMCRATSRASRFLVVHLDSGRDSRVDLPRGAYAFDLAVDDAGDRLAIVLADRKNNQTLYAAQVRDLAAGGEWAEIATKAPRPPAGCEWDHVTWSDADLLATRTCQRLDADPGGWPTTLYALDADTLQSQREGPTVAHDLGVSSIDADAVGHLVVWRSGGDAVGPIIEWTSQGPKRLPGPTCHSIDRQPDPCLREPAW